MTVSNELIDRLLADYKKPEDLIGENGLLKQLTKRLVERALEAEMAEHLGHDKNKPVANPKGNTRNGKSKKTLKGEFGELPIDIPEIAMAALSRRSCPSTKRGGRGLMTRSCPCIPAA
jgi:putative transposase